MPDFSALGYDKTVTLYASVPGNKYEDASYTCQIIKDCQVAIDHKVSVKKNGPEGANVVSVCFLCENNSDIVITENMLNKSFFVIGDTSEETICDDFLSYMTDKYSECYTLTSFNYEGKVLPHYELGGC